MNPGSILLVEDDENDAALARIAFERAQLANPFEVVGDGVQAIDYIAGNGPFADRQRFPFPAVVLLDLKLPRKSGFEVLEWLRRDPKLRSVPVVILTSSRDAPDIHQAYVLGASSYIVKPVTFERFLDIAKAIDIYWGIVPQPDRPPPEAAV